MNCSTWWTFKLGPFFSLPFFFLSHANNLTHLSLSIPDSNFVAAFLDVKLQSDFIKFILSHLSHGISTLGHTCDPLLCVWAAAAQLSLQSKMCACECLCVLFCFFAHPSHVPWLGIEPETFSLQASSQSAEAHQSGLSACFYVMVNNGLNWLLKVETLLLMLPNIFSMFNRHLYTVLQIASL